MMAPIAFAEKDDVVEEEEKPKSKGKRAKDNEKFFDPDALERGAKALREIQKSPYAKQASPDRAGPCQPHTILSRRIRNGGAGGIVRAELSRSWGVGTRLGVAQHKTRQLHAFMAACLWGLLLHSLWPLVWCGGHDNAAHLPCRRSR